MAVRRRSPIRSVSLSTIALLIVTISAAATAEDQRDLASSNLPSDVAALIGRRSSCNYWADSVGDPDQTERVRRVLKCETLAADERALRQKYQGNQSVEAALDATWVRVIRRLPAQPK